MIEFLAEWIVTLLSPATQIVKARAPHITFMFVKEYWFWEFYLGLKVTAFLGRDESYTRIIDGQVRCITQEHTQKRGQLIWNVEFLTIFVPAWMIPPIYHSLRRKCIKNAAHSPLEVLRMGTTFFLLSNPPKLAPLIVTFASTKTPATFIPNQSCPQTEHHKNAPN